MKKISRNNVIYILIFASILFGAIPGLRLWVLVSLWLILVLFSLTDIENRLLLLCFDFTLFVFIMTRLIIPVIYSNEYIENSVLYSTSFSYETYNFIIVVVFIALVASFLGFASVKSSSALRLHFDSANNYSWKIRNYAKAIFYVAFLLSAFSVIERFRFVLANGYNSSFIEFEGSLPGILKKIAGLTKLSFFLFLATMPSKKEAIPVILTFLFYSFLTLLTGARTSFILNLFIIIIYLFLRNRYSPEDPWISKRGKKFLIMSLPAIGIGMFLVLLVRSGHVVSDYNMFDMLINIFYQQGTTIDVLGYTFENRDMMPRGKFYSFGELIDNFNNNFVFHILGIAKTYKANTIEMAIDGHSLANYLTYQFQTQRFLSGGGMGSSYLAEVWVDFGYCGVFIWSFIYGIILAKFPLWSQKNLWLFALSFFMVDAIIYSPRDTAIGFLADIVSPTYLVVSLMIHLLAKKNSQSKS